VDPATRVLVADDHSLVSDGLAEILGAQQDFVVVGQASDGAEAVEMARALRPDVVLMDLTMPGLNGLEATRLLAGQQPECKVVILTIDADQHSLFEALNAGAAGYLLKTMRSSDLVHALRRMRAGEPPVAPVLAGHIVDEFRRLSARAAQAPAEAPLTLTKREEEVLALVATGASDKQIARALSISIYTVKAHMRNILAKLPVDGRREATRYARRTGLLRGGGPMIPPS
jgi:DNA-binding NarL/FixJ family response regulator